MTTSPILKIGRKRDHVTYFLCDRMLRDLSMDAIYILVPGLYSPFYQLIKLMCTPFSTPDTGLSLLYTMSRPNMQTLTLLNNNIQIQRKIVKFPTIYIHFFPI